MAMLSAVLRGDTYRVKQLLLGGITPDAVNEVDGWNALFLAFKHDKMVIAKLLLDNGASTMVPRKANTKDLIGVLERKPSAVHLLADYDGIYEEKERLNYNMSRYNYTQALCALRQVGVDAWCDGGGGLVMMDEKHGIDGTKLLGVELVDHTLQVRLRLVQLEASDAPLDLVVGTRVVLHSLTGAAINDEHGIVVGALGAQREGCYRVKLDTRVTMMQINADNLRVVDLGRAAVAGHEVDALQSVVLGGMTGEDAFCNGVYNLNPAHTTNDFPVFTHATAADQHLFCGETGLWFVGDTLDMREGANMGWIVSFSQSPSPLMLQWEVDNGTEYVLDPAVTLATPTWITGSPLDDWIFRDARVESYNTESHEHKLIFSNPARTSLHLRLDHLQFLDWDVLPRRRAAMLAPRTVVTALMILNRMGDGRVSKKKLLPNGTKGSALRILFAVMVRSPKDFLTIFRGVRVAGPLSELRRGVWPCVMAPVNPIVQRRVKEAEAAEAEEVYQQQRAAETEEAEEMYQQEKAARKAAEEAEEAARRAQRQEEARKIIKQGGWGGRGKRFTISWVRDGVSYKIRF